MSVFIFVKAANHFISDITQYSFNSDGLLKKEEADLSSKSGGGEGKGMVTTLVPIEDEMP